jgi:hypothetical protein
MALRHPYEQIDICFSNYIIPDVPGSLPVFRYGERGSPSWSRTGQVQQVDVTRNWLRNCSWPVRSGVPLILLLFRVVLYAALFACILGSLTSDRMSSRALFLWRSPNKTKQAAAGHPHV